MRSGDQGYLLDNQQEQAGQRFDALSVLFDAVTFAHMDRLGIAQGWHCWEVGAGGASVPSRMASVVGPAGMVLATDIDLAWMPDDPPFLTVIHELGRDARPDHDFDLVHARLVLVHVAARKRALADLIAALRPGGWLLVEEADPALQPSVCPNEMGRPEALANRLKSGFRDLMASRGVDLAYGRTLPQLMREGGLIDVEADAYFPVSSPASSALEIATTQQIRGRLIEAGLATEDDIAEHLANVNNGTMDIGTSPLISCWGRKPS